MNRILIIDGSNLLFQMFFGMPSRIVNEQGKAIQGTFGFVGALLKIIRKTEPTHIAVLFDGEHENVRAALDSDYKANRIDYGETPEENNPFSQLSDVYAALDYLGIKHTETVDCETDDWIAGYAFTYGQENEIVISSFDSDFFQLITDNVSLGIVETILLYARLNTSIKSLELHLCNTLNSNHLWEMPRIISKALIKSVQKRQLCCSVSLVLLKIYLQMRMI